MNKELLERTIEQLTWVLEQDVDMLQWAQEEPENKKDGEYIDHLSFLVEERAEIIEQLSKLKLNIDWKMLDLAVAATALRKS